MQKTVHCLEKPHKFPKYSVRHLIRVTRCESTSYVLPYRLLICSEYPLNSALEFIENGSHRLWYCASIRRNIYPYLWTHYTCTWIFAVLLRHCSICSTVWLSVVTVLSWWWHLPNTAAPTWQVLGCIQSGCQHKTSLFCKQHLPSINSEVTIV